MHSKDHDKIQGLITVHYYLKKRYVVGGKDAVEIMQKFNSLSEEGREQFFYDQEVFQESIDIYYCYFCPKCHSILYASEDGHCILLCSACHSKIKVRRTEDCTHETCKNKIKCLGLPQALCEQVKK